MPEIRIVATVISGLNMEAMFMNSISILTQQVRFAMPSYPIHKILHLFPTIKSEFFCAVAEKIVYYKKLYKV